LFPLGPLRYLTAVVDGNVSGQVRHEGEFVAVVGSGDGLGGVAEGMAEELDGVALEAQSDVGVDGGGDADVGVAEEFLDDDEFDALLQEERRGRVTEVVESDAAEPGLMEQGGEVPGEGGPFDRCAVGAVKT
jgi:hypothetical protein